MFVIVYGMLTKTWQLILTDRLLAARMRTFPFGRLRPTGETRSFPWTEIVSIDVHKGRLADTLRFSTAHEEIRYENLRKHDIEDLRGALRSVRPDLFPA